MLTKNKKGLIGVEVPTFTKGYCSYGMDWFNFDPSIIGALSALTSSS